MGKVLLVMGHRNTDEGNASEFERTPFVVKAAAAALKNAGHTVHVLQREDFDNDPDFTAGDLAVVANRSRELIQANGLDVMFDCHFQGSPASNSGCFCIFPDAAASGDGKADNPLDVKVASRLAAEVSALTGISRLMLAEPGGAGIMSERQTGVGLQGHRLGMFRLTLPVRETCVRLVMEHGDIVADRAIIDAPGFFDKVGRAYVRTVNAFWPNGNSNGSSNGHEDFQSFTPHRVLHTHNSAFGRQEASIDAKILKTFAQGESVVLDGFKHAEAVFGDDRWARTAGTHRRWIHQSGLTESLEP